MARRSSPDRIDTARRAAAVARLRSEGHPPDAAEALVATFAAEHGGRPDRAAWDRFDAWLLGRRGSPPRAPPLPAWADRPVLVGRSRAESDQSPPGRHEVYRGGQSSADGRSPKTAWSIDSSYRS